MTIFDDDETERGAPPRLVDPGLMPLRHRASDAASELPITPRLPESGVLRSGREPETRVARARASWKRSEPPERHTTTIRCWAEFLICFPSGLCCLLQFAEANVAEGNTEGGPNFFQNSWRIMRGGILSPITSLSA